ncbi:FtsX-like permease family protein [Corynebacterium sp. H78]|uniref:FtsX-like permease family protein n=1 Tax=Corynebacterium sp. H78 TaxID=3133417 RepID=UPI0030A5344C
MTTAQLTRTDVTRIPTKALVDLGVSFQRAGRESKTGSRWLSTLAVLAVTVSTWAIMIVAGGTWMFVERWRDPIPELEPLKSQGVLEFYVFLALVACVFVIPTTMSLIAQSAVLGASGREQRLATLRLLGLSNGAVTRMTMVETAGQALLGIALGTILSVATAPFWALLTFQDVRISTWEVLLPWWGYPVVWFIVMLLALVASVIGLKRVLVTPLGVSKRDIPKALKWWRVIAFAVIVGAGVMYVNTFDPSAELASSEIFGFVFLALVLFVMVSSVNIIAPFMLQVLAWVSRIVPGKTAFVATRRVATNGKEAWRRVSAMTFLGVLLGYITLMPMDGDEQFGDLAIQRDLVPGVAITFIVGFIIMLMSTLLNQASTVYEQAPLTRALDFIGTPFAFHRSVAIQQIFVPMLVMGALGFAFGYSIGYLTFGQFAEDTFTMRSVVIIGIFLASIVIATLMTAAVDPLRKQIIGRQVRRND